MKQIINNISKDEFVSVVKDTEENLVAEMLYEPSTGGSTFLRKVAGDEEFRIVPRISKQDDSYYVPFEAKSGYVRNGFVRFPSGHSDYHDVYELFQDVRKFISTFVLVPEQFLVVASVYVLMSWVYESFQVLPYLRVIGMPGTGKTRFLEVVGNLCYKPTFAGGSTSIAAVFRVLSEIRGTLVFDEADFKSSEMWNEIIKILNAGHTKGFPVTRAEKTRSGSFNPQSFDVFGPKILASRDRFGDEALESRCLTQYMPIKKDIGKPIHLAEEFYAGAASMRNKLLTFRMKNYGSVPVNESLVGSVNSNRLKQSTLAIASMADFIDSKVSTDVIDFTSQYERDFLSQQHNSLECDVLICILEFLLAMKAGERYTKKYKRLAIKELARRFSDHFYGDYLDRKETTYGHGDYAFTPSAYEVSPRKVGSIVNKKLMIRTLRDREGFYIPMIEESERLGALKTRYGITDAMLNTEDLKDLSSPLENNELPY